MLIISFHIKGIVYKKFVLEDQKVNSVYYCDVLRRLRKNSPQTLAKKELAVTTRQRTVSRLFLHQGVCRRDSVSVFRRNHYIEIVSVSGPDLETKPSFIYWAKLGRFHLQTETESSLRNVVA
jgi:hypothetical protein